MKTIDNVLINIPRNIKSDLKCSVATIHKIKNDTYFKELIKEHTNIRDAQYIVYSNYNQVRKSDFLDARGGLVISIDEVNQHLTYEELNFQIDHYNITENHPFKNIFDNDNDNDNILFQL